MNYLLPIAITILVSGCAGSKLNMKTGKLEGSKYELDAGRQRLTVNLFEHRFDELGRGTHDFLIEEDEVKYKIKYRF